uniref:Zinc finger protein 362 n=1 Tax=Macrostomum lignano TaxID=282301 RepID=A0A1I8FWV0_9PLAT
QAAAAAALGSGHQLLAAHQGRAQDLFAVAHHAALPQGGVKVPHYPHHHHNHHPGAAAAAAAAAAAGPLGLPAHSIIVPTTAQLLPGMPHPPPSHHQPPQLPKMEPTAKSHVASSGGAVNPHHLQHPYECLTCHKAFSRSYSLTTHMKIHSGVRDHRCPMCDKAYSRTDHLKRHIIHSHTPGGAPSAPKPPSAKNFICPACQKAFSDSSHLRRHMRTHPG